MIRLFNVFCKLDYIKKTAKELFYEAVLNININDFPCPRCGSRHPEWEYFGFYKRGLISYEDGKVMYYIVTVLRYQCTSCEHTHALLPEIAVPYSSYSILFMLQVLKDRYANKLTIDAICKKYEISANTFYRLVKCYERDKTLWCNVGEEILTNSTGPIDAHPSRATSGFIYTFWQNNGLSFLQQSLHGEIVHFDIRLHPPPAFSPETNIKWQYYSLGACLTIVLAKKIQEEG